MRQSLLMAASLLALVGCNQAEKPHYYLNATFSNGVNDKMAYIIDYDTEEAIDSAVIVNGVAEFSGELPESRYAFVSIDGKSYGTFYLEADSIVMTDGYVKSGGELNQKLSDYWGTRINMIKEFRELPDSLQKLRYDSISGLIDSMEKSLLNDNIENALGYYEFLTGPARNMNIQQLDSAIAAHPSLGKYKRIQKIRERLVKESETGEGTMFKDFEVEYDGKTYRLSDYVGKGKYVLVDFWASWCGPCIRQTAVIKEILKEYGPKGLEVLGVAVWDKPEDTLEGIKSHELPWTNIINAQDIPAEVYGFSGIPCIILFGPDGTILSRDKQGDALKADIAAAMNK